MVLVDQEDVDARTYIIEQIRAYNAAVSAPHRAVRKTGVRPLDIYLRDDQGELLGGLVASTYWNWLDIDDLWIHARLRRQGYGRQLLQMAEQEAMRRQCEHAYLKTFSFQARGFYEKLGYSVVGQLDDFPPGQMLYWLRKDLTHYRRV